MIKIFLILLSVLLCGSVCAAPSKPTVTNNGSTLSLSGTSFGSKTTAAPLKFDNFEDGVATQSIDTGGYWSTSWDAEGLEPVYSTSNLRTGSALHSYHSMDVGGGSEIISPNQGTVFDGANTKIYISFWYWYNRLDSDTDCQLKMWRIYGTASGFYPSLAYYNRLGSKSFEMRSSDGASCNSPVVSGADYFGDAQETWQHMEAYIDIGTIGGTGTWAVYIDGSLVADDDGGETIYSNSTCSFHTIRFGEWHATLDCETHTDITMWDDIYFDNSWSRVEVCNSGRTHCETQIPSAWGDTAITVTINQGSFSDSNDVYLYVYDDNGDISPASDVFNFIESSSSTGSIPLIQ